MEVEIHPEVPREGTGNKIGALHRSVKKHANVSGISRQKIAPHCRHVPSLLHIRVANTSEAAVRVH